MTAYNINNVARLMNEDAAKYNRETRKFEKNEEHMPGGHNAPSITKNVQPVKFQRNAAGKTEKVSDGSGKGKEKAKGNPFAKKGGKKSNPFAKKGDKKSNPFAKKGDKDGKKENPFAKKGQVEESIDRLLHLLEVLDPASLRSKNKAYQQAPRKPGAQKLTVGHDPEPYVDGKPKPRAWSLPDGMMIWQNQRALKRKGSGFQQDKGPAKKNIGTKDPYAAIAAKTATGRGYGATSSANRAFQDDENNRLQPYLDGLVRVADEIQDPGFSPKNTQNLMQKLQFLGNMVKEIENNSHSFDVRPLREVLNKYASLAQAYEFITKNPTYKIQEQMKQDPKNQAHYQKMLDYVNTNMDKAKEFTRFKDYFTDTFTRFIDDEGLRG